MPADDTRLCNLNPTRLFTQQHQPPSNRQRNCSNAQNSIFNLKKIKPCLKNSRSLRNVDYSLPSCNNAFYNPRLAAYSHAGDDCTCRTYKKTKRVTFSDNHGAALATVKYFNDTSRRPTTCFNNLPMCLAESANSSIFRQFNFKSNNIEPNRTNRKFIFHFKPPDYLELKKRLEANKVSLESVFIKNNASIQGTVKVKNIVYHKQLNIRITFDNWSTHRDVACDYAHNMYDETDVDTFKFSIDIPRSYFEYFRSKIEFCICFAYDSLQLWDNNNGANYTISSSQFAGMSKSHEFSQGISPQCSPPHENRHPGQFKTVDDLAYHNNQQWVYR